MSILELRNKIAFTQTEPDVLDFRLEEGIRGYVRFKGGDTIRFGDTMNDRELARSRKARERDDWKRPFAKVVIIHKRHRLVLPRCYIMDYKIRAGVLVPQRVRAWSCGSFSWPEG